MYLNPTSNKKYAAELSKQWVRNSRVQTVNSKPFFFFFVLEIKQLTSQSDFGKLVQV